MLAYVFWHWRQPAVAREEYERVLGRFHTALREAPPPGFGRSWVWRLEAAPWIPGGGAGYEDWYLVDGSAALDPLNDAAVTASRQAAHDHAARLVAGGTAGLYRLRAGEPQPDAARAIWFPKPGGLSYAALEAAFGELMEGRRFALWGRQMVLGSAPEFCLHVQEPIALPGYATTTVVLGCVWP
jgi:hypothetical protein